MNDDTSPNSKKRLHDIQREEKQFLMQAWCGQLLPPFEDGEPLSELAKRALLTARPYVEVSMANRIDALLGQNESESGVDLAQEDDAPFGEEDLFSEGDTSDDLFGTEDEYSSTASSRSSLSSAISSAAGATPWASRSGRAGAVMTTASHPSQVCGLTALSRGRRPFAAAARWPRPRDSPCSGCSPAPPSRRVCS